MKELFATIAVELPVDGLFTYRVPAGLAALAGAGRRAVVPFGNRTVTGYILELTRAPLKDGLKGIKDIKDIIDDEPLFDEKRLRFLKWLSSYYFSPLGPVLALTHPLSANVRGIRFLTLTDAGRVAADEFSGAERRILEAARKGESLATVLKRFKGEPVYSMIARLRKKGLLSEETRLKKAKAALHEKYLSLKVPSMAALAALNEKASLQARLYEYLMNNNGALLSSAAEALGCHMGQTASALERKGLLDISERRVIRDPLSAVAPRSHVFEPNQEQAGAISAIKSALEKNVFSPFLLYGVTGSGKTLVYLKAIEEAIKAGKKVIFMVPEISLTPWPAAYLTALFPGRVALVHSGLSEGERLDTWKEVLSNKVDIAVGPRSALFSPLKGLGLIIVDEEHEASYKQEDGVRYNGRDAALMLGKILGLTVVLGSATPSVETFYNAKKGKLALLTLKKRVMDRPLPDVRLVDLRGRKDRLISDELKSGLVEEFSKGNQALVLLNRRGFSSTIVCSDCGHSFICLNCSVTLTLHMRPPAFKCHYCDFTVPAPESCPSCKGVNLIDPGAGTQRVEDELKRILPDMRVLRMDRDSTSRKGAVHDIIDAFEAKKADALVGTQMASKGHHFPGITLVGIVSGDTSLNIPDFRSAERTFQLITQSAGRAGRGDDPGRVVIQTLNPGHYAFKRALTHDYDGFFEDEIALRREVLYPPFARLCCLRLEGTSEETVLKAADSLGRLARDMIKAEGGAVTALGPAPAFIPKVRGRFRHQMLLKAKDIKTLHSVTGRLKTSFEARQRGVTLIIDMDPLTVV